MDPTARLILMRLSPFLAILVAIAGLFGLLKAPAFVLSVGFAMGFAAALVIMMAILTLRETRYEAKHSKG